MGDSGHRCANPAATGGEHRHKSAPGHGAIVSGATLGSHACFYSDATVLTSSCCKIENMDHALSQIPYALCASGISALGYLVCGALL